MKKILITMAVLTSMVAGAMVFSSFAAPKQEKGMFSSSIKLFDRTWLSAGSHFGEDENGNVIPRYEFYVWGRSDDGRNVIDDDFWWTLINITPDQALNRSEPYGRIYKNEYEQYYLNFDGSKYYIRF